MRGDALTELWLCLQLQPDKCQENVTEPSKQEPEPEKQEVWTYSAGRSRVVLTHRVLGVMVHILQSHKNTHTLSPATGSPGVRTAQAT